MEAFIRKLNERSIDYRVIDKSINKVRILIKFEDKKSILNLLNLSGFKRIDHFYSKKNGYSYRYQLHELELYINGQKTIEIYYELPCVSLTPKTLLPLDKLIQMEAWKNQNRKDSMKCLPNKIYIVFLIAQCVFFKGRFDKEERLLLNEKKEMLQSKEVYKYLEKIFFSFTEQLIALLVSEKYDDIYLNYIKFVNY